MASSGSPDKKGDLVSSKSSRTRGKLIAVAGIAAVALVFSLPTTGADYSASGEGDVVIQTGGLTVELSDSENVGSFQLVYPGLVPGDSALDTFTVKNTGTIPGYVKLRPSSVNTSSVADLTPEQLGLFGLTIDDKPLPLTSVSAQSAVIELGRIDPGESITYRAIASLASAAGNEWQSRLIAADLTVTLEQ